MKNHYYTLGTNRGASIEEIKSSYRKLAQKFHPDKNSGDKFFEERFRDIQEAYEVLMNPYEKGRYDTNYDYFFSEERQYSRTYSKAEEPNYKPPKPDPEKTRREKEERQKRESEDEEKLRVANVKKNTALSFEDKAWIFLGNWFIIPGAVGLWMFIKYRSGGYNRKSNSVCSLTLISLLAFFILSIILVLAQEVGRSNH